MIDARPDRATSAFSGAGAEVSDRAEGGEEVSGRAWSAGVGEHYCLWLLCGPP